MFPIEEAFVLQNRPRTFRGRYPGAYVWSPSACDVIHTICLGVSSNGLLSDNTDDHKDEVALSSTLSVYQLHHHQAYVNTVSLVMKTAYCCILQSSIIYSGITFMTA